MEKICDEKSLEIYSSYMYDEEVLKRICIYFENKKKEILSFFDITQFRKVMIYLFESKEKYDEYMKKLRIPLHAYSKGRIMDGNIYYTFGKDILDDRKKVGYNVASIVHEFVHLVYHEKVNSSADILVEEGLATYLSGQKSLLDDDEKYEKWLKENVLNKEFPRYEYLLKHGDKYGEFVDCETFKYNGYDIAYTFVRYLVENGEKYSLIKGSAKEEYNRFRKNINSLRKI